MKKFAYLQVFGAMFDNYLAAIHSLDLEFEPARHKPIRPLCWFALLAWRFAFRQISFAHFRREYSSE
jgi:hypothetical protein